MVAATAISHSHPEQAQLLASAATGDAQAADSLLSQLGSANQWLRQIMVRAIRDTADLGLWQRLLASLALHRWGGGADCHRRSDARTSERIDAALVSLFVEDTPPDYTSVKLAVLHEGLTDPECRVRSTSATLLGLRGDARGIDVLIQAVRMGDTECRLRAVGALGKLNDVRGAWALLEALTSDEEELHSEASLALENLDAQALPAYLEALRHARQHVRWHAVRGLSRLDDLRAWAGLAEALGDDDYGVRWAAAGALTAIGEPAVRSILERLSRCILTEGMRQAAFHALHQMRPGTIQLRLQPLLDALRGPAAAAEVPMQAYRMLQDWR
jgi:HEAT repeat protein